MIEVGSIFCRGWQKNKRRMEVSEKSERKIRTADRSATLALLTFSLACTLSLSLSSDFEHKPLLLQKMKLFLKKVSTTTTCLNPSVPADEDFESQRELFSFFSFPPSLLSNECHAF